MLSSTTFMPSSVACCQRFSRGIHRLHRRMTGGFRSGARLFADFPQQFALLSDRLQRLSMFDRAFRGLLASART